MMTKNQLNHISLSVLAIALSILISRALPTCNTTSLGRIQIAKGQAGCTNKLQQSVKQQQIIHINFTIVQGPPLTNTFLIANLDQQFTNSTVKIPDFYHQDPKQITTYDLDAMWQSRTQFINLISTTDNLKTIYLSIINFDPEYRRDTVTVEINITIGDTYLCGLCYSGSKKSSYSCQYQCQDNKSGELCTRTIVQLKSNSTITLQSQKYKYFSISNTNSVVVEISTTNCSSVQGYFQFQQFKNQIANFYNVAKSSDSTGGSYRINDNNGIALNAETKSRTLLITLINFETTQCKAHISYNIPYQINTLAIIISVLGSILLIALIISITYLIRRRMIGNARISSQIATVSNELTASEIQKYFPACFFNEIANNCSSLVQSSFLDQTMGNHVSLTTVNQPELSSNQFDCVICLQQIKLQDKIRICYCKHLFHSNCLIGWFNKQRACPYCRKSYTKAETEQQYQKLTEQNNNKAPKNVEIAKCIFKRKTISKSLMQIFD